MKIKALRGTKDILPGQIEKWQYIERTSRKILENFGFSEIRTPTFESTSLFARSIGQTTDIVTKEMYTFQDPKRRSLTLRPEGTASIVRAWIEHRLTTPAKLYYLGPFFRYERPQAGRHREFFQIGAETIGSDSPASDAEIIALTVCLFEELGLKGLDTQLNSVGCSNCQSVYKLELKNYFKDNLEELCEDCQIRLTRNPLRVLDCKNKECQRHIAKAPAISSYLCKSCVQHLKKVRDYLDGLNIVYSINPRLVRGFDYYTRTAFEVIDYRLGAKNAIAAGGRYDDLIADTGGPPTPAVGMALGVERLILALEAEGIEMPGEAGIDVFVASLGEAASLEASKLAYGLRQNDLGVQINLGNRSLKGQMRLANRLRAKYVLIFGQDELAKDQVVLRDMATGSQEELFLDGLAAEVAKRIKTTRDKE